MSDGNSMPAEHDAHLDKKQRLDKYDEIDKRINSDMAGSIDDDSNLSDNDFRSLLSAIRGYSDGQISWTCTKAEVLKKNAGLKDKLRAAWAAKSYREILDLDYLQSSSGSGSGSGPPTMSSLGDPAWNPKEVEKTQMVLQDAWKKPYSGDYHTVLFEMIEARYQRESYKNICDIVQSSGTGKSRMVDELAKSVYTLPINIRSEVGIYATFPLPDNVLHGHLVQDAPWDEGRCRTYYETFFRCLFSRSLEELSEPNPSGNLARNWYDRMDVAAYRHDFYKSVVELSKSPIDIQAQSALAELQAKLREHSTNKKIHILIYIDEAHELKGRCDKGRTKLDLMCSVISDFHEEPLFCLLLSTQSSLRFLAPTKEAATSERAKISTGLLAPITETPFDCFPELAIKSGVLRMEDLSKLEHVAMWGRPLWWAMVREGDDKLIKAARMKLLCSHDIDRRYGYVANEALIAVMDVLLAFDFQPNRELSEDIQARLVKSHMRIAYSVPEHRHYFRSGYSSEPLLAEAASQQLLKFQELDGRNSFDVMVAVLEQSQLLRSTLIDVGQRGEVFMRMCLMRAYMDGVLQDLGSNRGGIIFSKGCKLTTFIEQLFEPQYARMVLDAKPDNVKSNKTFSQAFAHSMVRFTHFAKAGDQYAMSSDALFGAFARGMAFIGYQTQQAVDFAIPVFLQKGETLQESTMSAILIQVKRRIEGRGPTTFSFREEVVDLFPPRANDGRPYITLVAEVGIEPEGGKISGIETPSVHIMEQPQLMHHPPNVHPRYAIVAYGCTGVYKDVNPDKRALFLATRDFAEEHPHYQIRRSLDLMMRLKPIWQHGENSYHWLDSELVRKPNK